MAEKDNNQGNSWMHFIVDSLGFNWKKFILSGSISVTAAIAGTNALAPGLLRLDIIFPTKEPEILDDFVYVHFIDYRDMKISAPLEKYRAQNSATEENVFDKATYVEHVWLRKTNAPYEIRLGSTGIPPQIQAIDPPIKAQKQETRENGVTIVSAQLDLNQSHEFIYKGVTPNPKTVYVYRNGFQGKNSFGGKNVFYPTERLTIVYDFSAIPNYQTILFKKPKGCILRKDDENYDEFDINYRDDKGIAILEAFNLKKGDKVRIFWTWRKSSPENELDNVKCSEILL